MQGRFSLDMDREDTVAKDNKEEPSQKKANLGKGMTYLLVSAGIVALLLYVLPVMVGLDVRSILKSDLSLGVLRVSLGVVVVAYAIHAIVVMVRRCTLEGENWHKGFENMRESGILGSNLLTIALLVAGGVALVGWGILGIL